jgi:hypothetical protein
MSSLNLAGDTSGTITLTVPATAGTNTITLPAATGTLSTQTSSTGALLIPVGTTGERPGSPVNGQIRYNTTTGAPEWYNSSTNVWVNFNQAATYSASYLVIAGGASGGCSLANQTGAGGGASCMTFFVASKFSLAIFWA